MVDKDQIEASMKQDDVALQTRQTQEALLESELQYRTTLNSMGDPIFVVDTEFEITLVNDALKQWSKNFDLENDIIGKSIFTVFTFLTEDIRNEYLEVIRTGQVMISEETFIINGREVTTEIRKIPITEGGKIAKVVTVLHDITKQNQAIDALKRSEQFNQVIVESFPLGFSVRSKIGQLLIASKVWRKIWGVSEAEVQSYMHTRQEFAFDEHDYYLGKYASEVQRIYESGGSLYIPELKFIRRKDGKEIWVSQYFYALQNESGDVERVVILTDDISERKQVEKVQQVLLNISQATSTSHNLEELLYIIRQQLSSLIDTTNFYVALYDPKKDLYYFPYFVDQVDQDEFSPRQLNKGLTDYVRRTGTSLLADKRLNQQLIQRGEVIQIGSPSEIWLGAPLKTTQGVIGVVVVQSYTDITLYTEKDLELLTFVSGNIAMAIERKRAEEELRQSEEKYRSLVETAPDVIYSISAEDGTLLSLNSAFEKITGWQCSEWLGKEFSALIHPDDLALARETSEQVFHGEAPPLYELRVLSKSGEYLTGEFTSMPLIEKGRIVGEFGIVRDISRRKRAEESLMASEKRYHDLIELSPDGIVIHQEGKVVFANRSALKLVGCKKPNDLLGKSISDFVHPDYREKVTERVKTMLSRKTSAPLMEEKFVQANGTPYDVEVVAISTSYDAKPAVQVEFRDISERKHAEEERAIHQRELEVLYSFNEALTSTLDIKTILKQSLQLTLKATGLASAGIYMLDKEGYLQMVTSQGFSSELQSFARRLEKGTLYTWRAIEQNAMQEVSINEYPESDFKRMLLKEGLKLLICIPLTSKDKPLGVMNLISKKAKVLAPWERDLLQSFGHHISIASENALYFESLNEHAQALERMLKERSQFFSMASHELRTPITVINGYLDIINRNFENMGKIQIREIFKKLGDHSERLCLLVETLLNISKLESPIFAVSRKTCEIGPIVERAIYLCEHQAKSKNIAMRTKKLVVSGRRLRVLGDPIAIENVLINILENAIKYSYDKGEISINWIVKGNTLQLNCTDKGVGLPPGEQERIFDEFYRVERGGELKKSGTGLGLSIAKRLVERMGGRIWARSKGLGKGIIISFTLPLSRPNKSSKAKNESPK